MRISDWSSDVCSSDLRSFFRSSEAERRGASWRPSGCHCPVADCDRSRSALVDGGDGGDVRSCPQPYFLARRARLDAGGLSPLLSLDTAFRRGGPCAAWPLSHWGGAGGRSRDTRLCTAGRGRGKGGPPP